MSCGTDRPTRPPGRAAPHTAATPRKTTVYDTITHMPFHLEHIATSHQSPNFGIHSPN
eukprot:CAMPEP_0201974324 /NCGR_PEP_ID=MMETSP0904-20121228/49960_1 /ASSEMBLY_ACC=CAM_ASM_000553 /TAXON_ID=420261 /ORGANISM="Thalassiosira antarctica, Strain CCMP982" /LENGTH=57 /DNA_ID=CAMNT_0048524815 /DNA_START=47 /DNA_END=217 /DNA_ORIENTATION=+